MICGFWLDFSAKRIYNRGETTGKQVKKMIFYYIRHGDPIYNPNGLTPLGARQAEALGKRLAVHGLDRIFASSSERAIQTAKPAAELLKKNIEILDWANEDYACQELTVRN